MKRGDYVRIEHALDRWGKEPHPRNGDEGVYWDFTFTAYGETRWIVRFKDGRFGRFKPFAVATEPYNPEFSRQLRQLSRDLDAAFNNEHNNRPTVRPTTNNGRNQHHVSQN